jgi:hypothetical protein
MGSTGEWIQFVVGLPALACTILVFVMIFRLHRPPGPQKGLPGVGSEEAIYNRGFRKSLIILWTGLLITCVLTFLLLLAVGLSKGAEVAVGLLGLLGSVTASLVVGVKAAVRYRRALYPGT